MKKFPTLPASSCYEDGGSQAVPLRISGFSSSDNKATTQFQLAAIGTKRALSSTSKTIQDKMHRRNRYPIVSSPWLSLLLFYLAIASRMLLVSARYDPLINKTEIYPNFGRVEQEYHQLMTQLRNTEPRYQLLYQYQLDEKERGHPLEDNPPHCLHFSDNSLLQEMRVAYLQEMAPLGQVYEMQGVVLDEETFRLNVPNVGVYKGFQAALEYSAIGSGHQNNQFTTLLRREWVEQVPYYADKDTLATTTAQINDWNRGLKVEVTKYYQEFKFRPCSIALDALTFTFEDADIDTFLDQRYSDRYLCERIMNFCHGDNQQYASMEDCIDFMGGLQESDPACDRTSHSALADVSYSLEGNTSACRFLHHFMAAPEFSPDTHCPHVGKLGGPDPNGNYKCSSQACSKKKDTKLTSSSSLPTCQMEWKHQAELAMVAALPMCLEAITSGTCTISCKQALAQFGLAGDSQSSDFMAINQGLSLRTRTCACSRSMRDSPLSSTLKLLPFSAAPLLASCGVVGKAEDIDKSFDPCQAYNEGNVSVDWSEGLPSSENFLRQIVTDLVNRSIQKGSAIGATQEEEQQQSESMLMDLEYVKHFKGGNFLSLLPEAAQKGGCPFFHGPIVGAYEDVLAALQKGQIRSKSNALSQVDMPNYDMFPADAFAFFDTGSKEHAGLLRALHEAFPILSKPLKGTNAIEFKELPEELLQQSFADVVNPSKEQLISFTSSMYRYVLEMFFPDASTGFLDKIASVYTNWSLLTEDVTVHSKLWHSTAGQGLIRLYQVHMKQAAEMIEAYFGPEVMGNFHEYTKGTLSIERISRSFAGQLYNGLLVIGLTQPKLYKRIGQNPCKNIKVFKANPHSYVLEEFRLANLALAGNAVIVDGESVQVDYLDQTVEYIGGTTWKAGSPYSIQYSLSSANTDGSVFPQPLDFDPSRKNLNLTLTFGAPEYTFQSGLFATSESAAAGTSGARGCPAHNVAIGLLVTLNEQLFMEESFCYERQHKALFSVSVTTTWILAILVLAVVLFGALYLTLVVQPQLQGIHRKLQEPLPIGTRSKAHHGLLGSSLDHPEDPESRLVIRNLSLVKTKSKGSFLSSSGPVVVEKTMLSNVDTELVAGRLTGLMGPSGAGKSSLLNAIARFGSSGVLASGQIYETSLHGAHAQGSVAYVHHDYKVMLFEELTGLENLVIGGLVRFKDFPSDAAIQNMQTLVDGMKLQSCLATPVKSMSSGEKRRMSIAVECLKPSKTMLLDEPLSGLDGAIALETVLLLKQICHQFQKKVLLVVHQPSQEVFEAIDDLIIMNQGQCVFSGPRCLASEALGVGSSKTERANPADLLIEYVATMDMTTPNAPTSDTSDDASAAASQSFASWDSLELETGNDNGTLTGLAPFQQRFLACAMSTWLSLRDCTVIWMLFLFVPVAIFFLSAYNLGPNTAPQEAIVMIVMLMSGPSCLLEQTTASSRFSRLLPLVNMKRCGLYSGVEYSIQLLLFYSSLAFGMTIIVYTTSLLVGLIEILTVEKLLESLAIAFALQLTVVVFGITLNLMVSRPGVADHKFYEVNNDTGAALMVYLGIGLVFSGLLYRTEKAGIPYLYAIISNISPAYWAGLGMMVTLLDGAVFAGCSESNPSLLCLGDTFLLNYGLDKLPHIPGLSIWVLLAMAFLSINVGILFGWRPWEKSLQFINPKEMEFSHHQADSMGKFQQSPALVYSSCDMESCVQFTSPTPIGSGEVSGQVEALAKEQYTTEITC